MAFLKLGRAWGWFFWVAFSLLVFVLAWGPANIRISWDFPKTYRAVYGAAREELIDGPNRHAETLEWQRQQLRPVAQPPTEHGGRPAGVRPAGSH